MGIIVFMIVIAVIGIVSVIVSRASRRRIVTLNDDMSHRQREKATIDNLPSNMTPAQVSAYCANLWADALKAATAKGVAVYTTPCGSGTTPNVLANVR